MPVLSTLPNAVEKLVSKLRFPQLFLLVGSLFLLDLLIPFADEILLGLMTVLLGSLRRPRAEEPERPVKDVTPRAEN